MVIVLLSGGVDSAVCALLAKEAGHHVRALHIDYGQPAREPEGLAAARVAAELFLPLHYERIGHRIGMAMEQGIGAEGPRIAPGRNLLLLSLGVALAHSLAGGEVWLGCNHDDSWDYPDCRPAFVDSASALAFEAYNVRVRAPLINWTKREVVQRWVDAGHALSDTWSCYQPHAGEQCGRCNACRLRNGA